MAGNSFGLCVPNLLPSFAGRKMENAVLVVVDTMRLNLLTDSWRPTDWIWMPRVALPGIPTTAQEAWPRCLLAARCDAVFHHDFTAWKDRVAADAGPRHTRSAKAFVFDVSSGGKGVVAPSQHQPQDVRTRCLARRISSPNGSPEPP